MDIYKWSFRNNGVPIWLHYALFVLVFGIILFLFNIPSLFFSHPQGIHFIRQTDTLSFVQHYLLNGMNFIEPGVLSKNSIDGNVSCEFPLFYYLIALISKSGIEPYIAMRFLSLSLTFFALLSVYHTCLQILKSVFTSLTLTFLLFSSSVWVYYANGFSPDSMALSLSLIGLSAFYQLQSSDRFRILIGIVSIASFTMAALLKLTFAIYPIALVMTYVWSSLEKTTQTVRIGKKYIWLLFSGLIIAGTWFLLIVPQYNSNHEDFYFLTSMTPIWELSQEDIQIVWDHVSEWWFNSYYYPQVMHLIGICLVLFGVFFRRLHSANRKLVLLSILGCLAYFILFYRQFRDHDYYALVAGPMVFLLFLELFRLASSKLGHSVVIRSIAQIALAVLTIISLEHGADKFTGRYGDTNDYFAWIGYKMNGIDDYLDTLGIDKHTDILVVGDFTPNGGLYFAGRMGWSIPDSSPKSLKKASTVISNGVEVVLVANPELEFPNRIAESDLTEIGTYNQVKVYKVQ